MLTGLTRREQRILLFLVGMIVAGLAIHHFRTGFHREDLSKTQEEKKGGEKKSVGEEDSPETVSIPTYPIDVNAASIEDLCLLPHIGEVKAKAIVAYREKNKGFRELNEITRVPGIGDATFQKIREKITLEDRNTTQTTEKPSEILENPIPVPEKDSSTKGNHKTGDIPRKININTAGMEELMTLEQIGEVKAKRIMEYRSRYGPFRSERDLLKIRGIGEKILSLNRDKIAVSGD
ncbi:helix-hairpin-helix domain-containing protein [Candidatus Sumerlaeota bacterium]|nr:helix-hairpin-helix domain-containing protein [Candidatus Sumerlaeota bacterium]